MVKCFIFRLSDFEVVKEFYDEDQCIKMYTERFNDGFHDWIAINISNYIESIYKLRNEKNC